MSKQDFLSLLRILFRIEPQLFHILPLNTVEPWKANAGRAALDILIK